MLVDTSSYIKQSQTIASQGDAPLISNASNAYPMCGCQPNGNPLLSGQLNQKDLFQFGQYIEKLVLDVVQKVLSFTNKGSAATADSAANVGQSGTAPTSATNTAQQTGGGSQVDPAQSNAANPTNASQSSNLGDVGSLFDKITSFFKELNDKLGGLTTELKDSTKKGSGLSKLFKKFTKGLKGLFSGGKGIGKLVKSLF